MIVLFLGSWRSTLVVMISIPLSILSSLVVLYFLGDTINTMTLGELALAIGILVDNSTVTIENTHRLLTEEHMPLPSATLHGAAGIAVPTLVSTLAISCVFISVVFLHGPAKYLFTPLGLAVVFAMLASYGFSRTLTPITIGLLLKNERHGEEGGNGWFARFERGFEAMRGSYTEILHTLLRRRLIVPAFAVAVLALGGVLFMFVGRDFFPIIDGGQIQLHVRVPAGTRIEKTEQIFQAVEDKIREVIPQGERDLIVDNIGLPARSYNYAFGDGTAIGVNDGVILVALTENHAPTATYIRKLREILPAAFPENIFYFQAADMVTQILNFGIPAQINVRTVGYDRNKNLRITKEMQRQIAAIPGVADVHLQQEVNGPEFFAQIDRARAAQFGLTVSDIALNLNTSLSSSEQISPNFWTDPSNGTPYYLTVQTPEYRVASLNDLKNTPVTKFTVAGRNTVPGLLSNVATLKRDSIATNTNQANIQPLYEIYANADGRDLGSISGDIGKIVAEYQKQLSPGNRIEVIGQIDSMNAAFRDLAIGILFAASSFICSSELSDLGRPARRHSGPAGNILRHRHDAVYYRHYVECAVADGSDHGDRCGVGKFDPARHLCAEQQLAGMSAFDAAISAGRTRIRPVLMTAAAMIVGMIPMAIGGAGEEQNAALARAVIGGLLFATPTTLFVVPYLFALLRKGNDGKPARGVFAEDPQ